MNLRTVVALAATCAIAIGACNKKDEAPAAPTGEAAPAAAGDEAAPPAGDEAAADEAKPDEAAADEAAADEAAADPAPAAAVAEGDDAMKKAMAIQRQALELLKANKDDPAAAAAALEKLHAERKDEIAAIQADFAKMSDKFKDDPSAAMEMMGKHMGEIQELTKLTTDLLSEAPELMGSPAVAAAMGKLSPDMGDDDADHADHDHGHDHDHGDHDHGHDHGEVADGPKLSDEDKALLDEMLVAQEKMVEILSTHASDPDKAGDELMAYATDKSDSLAKFQGVQQRLQGDQAAAMEFAQKHMPRIAALGQKLSEIVQANPGLLTNEKVQAAMAKMNGGQ